MILGGNGNIYQSALVVGKTYELTFTVSNYVQGYIRNVSQTGSIPLYQSNGTFTETFVANNSNLFMNANASASTQLSIDNVSVKEYITATNTPRLDYSTGAEAFLLEPQSTNLVLNSDSGNFKSPTPPLTNTLAPDGTNNAVIPNPTSNANRYEYYLAGGAYSSGQKVTYSWYRKRISTPANDTIVGDLQIQALVNLTIFESTTQIQSNINGYDRFQVVVQVTDGSLSSTFRAYFGTVIGVGNSSVAYWGHQFEAGGYATSIIPTDGLSVTRNQETCINATPEINSEEGVLYAEISALANDGTLRMIVLNDGTQSNRVGLQYSSTNNLITAAYDIGGAGQASLNYTLTDAQSFNKIAFKYRQNDFSLYVNGIEVATDLSGNVLPANTLNNLEFEYGDNRFFFFGNTKDVQVYTKALSDAELIKLTT